MCSCLLLPIKKERCCFFCNRPWPPPHPRYTTDLAALKAEKTALQEAFAVFEEKRVLLAQKVAELQRCVRVSRVEM